MNTLRNLLVAILLICSSSITSRGEICGAIAERDKQAVLTYLRRQFDLPDDRVVAISATSEVGGTCYHRLTVTGLHSDQTAVVVYLSPDKRYLTSAVADITSDPRQARLAARQQVISKLRFAAFPHMEHSTLLEMTEFVDYQCPYCKQLSSWINELPPSLQGQVSLTYINFPLPMHSWARSAALYALCVSSDDRDLSRLQTSLFQEQGEITSAGLPLIVDEAFPLRRKEITTCASDPATSARLEEQIVLAKDLHVSSTPAVFLNGRQIPITSKNDLVTLLNNELLMKNAAPVSDRAASLSITSQQH